MTGKIILVFTFAPTYVTLKRIFIPMTSHVDGVKDIVGKVHVTVLAVVEAAGPGRAGWELECSAGCFPRLEYLCGHSGSLAWPCHRTVVPLDRVSGPRLGAGGRGVPAEDLLTRQKLPPGQRLLHHEGLLLAQGTTSGDAGSLAFRVANWTAVRLELRELV